jgi:crotonobetainyl-CoA:carnitine CoA-transferase CaiB-like acyl-CoA transferase
MKHKTLVPERFGPLSSLRIVSTGILIAQPYAAALCAEMGAEVIQVERPVLGDFAWRHCGITLDTKEGLKVATNWVQDRRNMFCVTLDFAKRRGREILFKLIERADVWMENSKGGTYAKLGITDEKLLEINPRLVITHVSGYGQTGRPEYVHRASYDLVGQAFGGMMAQTGFPDPAPPALAAPFTGDYLTALYALWATLAAVISARETGKGQSIDLAQYEAIHHMLGGTMVEYFQRGVVRERHGNRTMAIQPLDSYQASDGWVVVGAVNAGTFMRLCRVIGLDANDPKWQNALTNLENIDGIAFDEILRGWIRERLVAEVVKAFNGAQVACSAVMSSKDMAADPQYQARNMHIEWEDGQAGKVKGVGIAPKYSHTPGKIWRGAVGLGFDNQRVYSELLGISAGELKELSKQDVI